MQVTKQEFEILHRIATDEDQTETGEDIINSDVWIAFSRRERDTVRSCVNKGYVKSRDMYNCNVVHMTPEGYKAYVNALIDLPKTVGI